MKLENTKICSKGKTNEGQVVISTSPCWKNRRNEKWREQDRRSDHSREKLCDLYLHGNRIGVHEIAAKFLQGILEDLICRSYRVCGWLNFIYLRIKTMQQNILTGHLQNVSSIFGGLCRWDKASQKWMCRMTQARFRGLVKNLLQYSKAREISVLTVWYTQKANTFTNVIRSLHILDQSKCISYS